MKVIVVAGGTGGHIYPAIAIIRKIQEMEKDSEILYIGTNDRMEKDIIPKMGIKFVGLEMSGLNRKNIFANIGVLKKFRKAVKRAEEEIDKFKPDVVVGAGGYITAPVLYAAHKKNIPTLIHEQNSIPGLSNKFISKFADRICVSLPHSLELFPKEKVCYTGNPRSEEIIEVDDKEYQVLIITGKAYYDDYKDIEVSKNVKIVPFMDNLIKLLKDSDLIVSRAGASTIAEITAIGLPAILVPSPYVTNNHQYKNAKELSDKGACIIVSEEDFSKDKIINEIDKLFDNSDLYDKMSKESRKLGIDDSATRIYEEIRKIIR